MLKMSTLSLLDHMQMREKKSFLVAVVWLLYSVPF